MPRTTPLYPHTTHTQHPTTHHHPNLLPSTDNSSETDSSRPSPQTSSAPPSYYPPPTTSDHTPPTPASTESYYARRHISDSTRQWIWQWLGGWRRFGMCDRRLRRGRGCRRWRIYRGRGGGGVRRPIGIGRGGSVLVFLKKDPFGKRAFVVIVGCFRNG